MRAFIAAAVVVLALAGGALALPPPNTNADPTLNFLVTRILPNGNEIVLDTFAWTGSQADEERIRQLALSFGRLNRTNNPAWHVVVYGPTDGAYWTEDDRVWSSRTDG
jgi:hypothetical protein